MVLPGARGKVETPQWEGSGWEPRIWGGVRRDKTVSTSFGAGILFIGGEMKKAKNP